jgi:hypothetical protein
MIIHKSHEIHRNRFELGKMMIHKIHFIHDTMGFYPSKSKLYSQSNPNHDEIIIQNARCFDEGRRQSWKAAAPAGANPSVGETQQDLGGRRSVGVFS